MDGGETALPCSGRWLMALVSGMGSCRSCWPVQRCAKAVMEVGEGVVVATLVLLVTAVLLRHTGGKWWQWGLSEGHRAGVGMWHVAGKAGTLPEGQAALGHRPASCKCPAAHLYVTHLKPCMFPKHKYMAPVPSKSSC